MFRLPDKITFWNEIANDGFGNLTYSTPVTVPARIAFKTSKTTDSNGDDFVSQSVAYTESVDVRIGSQVLFGVSVSADPDSGANDVRLISSTPSGTDLRKLWFA